MTALSDRVQAAVWRVLGPTLPAPPLRQDSRPSNHPLESAQVAPCGCAAPPPWYTELGRAVLRLDALGDDYDAAFEALQAEIDQITAGVEVPVTAIAREVVRHNMAETDKVLGGVPGGPAAFDGQVARFVQKNVELVRSVPEQHLGRLREMVQGAQGGGTRVEDLAASIQASFGLPRARAMLVARDQVLKLNSQITQERQQRAGITSYVWTTSKDERVRGRPGGVWARSQSDHWVLDGKEFKWTDPPVTNPVTGERNHPGGDYQCRCVAVPSVERVLRG